MQHDTHDVTDGLLAELGRAGEHPDPAVLDRVRALGPAVVPSLIAMALDEKLHQAEDESPAVWAPLHAIQLLGELGAAEAVEPLLPLLSWDDETLGETLAAAFGHIGAPALPPLRALLFDRSQDIWTRSRAGDGLVQIAQHHPELRAEVVGALVARLDPAESQTPEDETLDGLVVTQLLDLEAREALPAIERAFEEDRVDRRIVDLDHVRRELGLSDEPLSPDLDLDLDKPLRLWLRCTACGYERPHDVEKVYCDLTTQEQHRWGEKSPYSEFIIPQRITCPKCGAVDQYELTGEAHLALTAELLKTTILSKGKKPAQDDGEGRLVFRRFTAAGREMHPYAAREMYRRQVEAEPQRADLRVPYGSVLRFLGYRDDAAAQYRAAVEIDPTNVEAYYNLGQLAREAGDRAEAGRMFRRILEVLPDSGLPHGERVEYANAVREELAELNAPAPSVFERLAHVPPPRADKPGSTLLEALRQPAHQGAKVGRNDPCPCGSGKKYKKCCGR